MRVWLTARLRTLRTALHLLGGTRVAVVGQSMEPALRDGDHLLISRLAYRLTSPRRGDLVLVRTWASAAGRPECIKRIVGLPHERISVRAGAVAVNGRSLPEPYRTPPADHAEAEALQVRLAFTRAGEWTLSSDEYFLLGDNRAASTDSRDLGPVRRAALSGKAIYRYAPPERRGQV
jgi:signal peptidase I